MAATDAELVEAVRTGDREAAGELARRHLRACRAVALAIVREVPGAEDVCQDAFVYAMERIDDCRDPARFGSWLRQIARSRAKNYLRSRRIGRVLGLDQISLPVVGDSPEEESVRADARERLLAALGELSETRREVVLLHDLEGWTHQEIADRMELPPGTVRSHLHHARSKLRELLRGLRE
jgi:RNA polymerase sigma-70 factor (ECF subfamily)